MTVAARIRRQQIMREAEGYLDLITALGDRWDPPLAVRQRLAQRALDALDRLDAGTERGHAQYLRGQALRSLERFADALTPLRQAAEDEPSDIHVWLALGWCYKRTGRLDLAIESLQEALEVEPGTAIIHYNLACYWSLAHNASLAIQFLSQALAMDTHYRAMIDAETDFDPIRGDPGFQALTSVIV